VVGGGPSSTRRWRRSSITAALDGGNELTVDLLYTLHEQLLTGVLEDRVDTDTVGAFETRPNHIGVYLPPVPVALGGAMDALLTYYLILPAVTN